MTGFKPNVIDDRKASALRARARSKLFFALRKAAKARGVGHEILGKDIADAIGKDRAFVSRVLNGTNQTMDFETLVSFLEVLGHNVDLDVRSFEDLASMRCNVDARPLSFVFSPRAQNAPGTINLATPSARNSPSIANVGAYHAK